MIEIEHLQKSYGRHVALEAVSLRVPAGELTYLLGRNGAGKSTLLRCLAGITRFDTGAVRVNGRTPAQWHSPAIELGVHLGTEGLVGGHTARRHLRWIAAAAGVPDRRVREVLDFVDLSDVADRRLSSFSLGMRQRVGIAAALIGDPPALIFDEPLNGLDIAGIIWFRAVLRDFADEGRGVLIASHLLGEVERTADRVVVLDNGSVIADADLPEFVGTHASLEDAYRAVCDVEFAADPMKVRGR